MNESLQLKHAVKSYSEDFQEFSEIVGVTNAVAFADKNGGRYTTVMRWHDDHSKLGKDAKDMVDMFGADIAKAACLHFAGCQIKMPACARIKTQMKALQIIAAIETKDMTNDQAAEAFGLSKRSIQDVNKKGRAYYLPTAYGNGEEDG